MSVREIEAEIDRTRADLVETVGALSDTLGARVRSTRTKVAVGVVAATGIGVGIVLWRRRH